MKDAILRKLRRLPTRTLTAAFILAACTNSNSNAVDDGYIDGECHPTITEDEFTPPEPYLTSRKAEGMAWYGTSELWTVLALDGDHSPRKSVWWSENFQGGVEEEQPDISVTWRQLDGDQVHAHPAPGTNAYTDRDGSFMIGAIEPDIPGCWEVTATYKGASLSSVYERK